MPKPRDTVTYVLYDGSRKVYIGMTSNPDHRVRQHELEGKKFSRMEITSHRMSIEGARSKELEHLKSYRSSHGQDPKYNRVNRS